MPKKINIPKVTGNIVITATAKSKSNPTIPDGVNGINYMTYGKGINQTTGVIKDESACWATIDPVNVIQGETYTLSLDATWGWVYSFDDNGKFVSPLSTGSNSNPQNITFVADTGKIRYGCYDPDKKLTYCNLSRLSALNYLITKKLSNCTCSNTMSSVAKNGSYSTKISANSGYTLGNIKVTMGGKDITSTAVNGTTISISKVTGNIVISCIATANSNSGGGGSDLTGTYLFFGDSICYGGGTNGYGYPQAIKAKQPAMSSLNYGVSGTCIARNTSYDVKYPSILSKIQKTSTYADYIVLEGGVNDSWGNRNPIGSFRGGTAPTTSSEMISYGNTLNEYQFADALEKCFIEIKLKWWGKKIFFVITHRINEAYSNPYYNLAIQICNKWGVIVIDLRNSGCTSKDTVDGTHSTRAAYDNYYAPNIINVLRANK